jgi:hypothetical protein
MRSSLWVAASLPLVAALAFTFLGVEGAGASSTSRSDVNLVINGDFANGNTDFKSQYSATVGLGSPAAYGVATNPIDLGSEWPDMSAHDERNGNMLIVNGATTANLAVWSQKIDVAPESKYVFAMWVATLYTFPATFDIEANGHVIGTVNAPVNVGHWKHRSVNWSSGATSTVKLAIVDTNMSFDGNDFALDDISLSGPPDATQRSSLAPIALTLGTPREIFHSWRHNVEDAIITVLIILFLAFPANIFNQTFSENYAEIKLMVANGRRRLRRLSGRRSTKTAYGGDAHVAVAATASENETPGKTNRFWFLVTLSFGAILGGFLSPSFGLNARSIEDFVATLVTFSVTTLLSWRVAKWFRGIHHYPTATYLKALPLGLAIALASVTVSRFTHFQPGYLYGIVVSLAFAGTLADRHNAHLIAISSLSTLCVAVIAWFAWLPVNQLALNHANDALIVIADDLLASIFVGGMVGTVIGLLPLRGMPGGHLSQWRRDVWAVVFFVALFLLIEVELRPAAGPGHPGGAPVVTAVILFALFGGLSFGTRHYFTVRHTKARSLETPTASNTVGQGSPQRPDEP